MSSLMALLGEKHLKVLLSSLKLGSCRVYLLLIISFSLLSPLLPLNSSSITEGATTSQRICNEGVANDVNDSNLAFSKQNIQQEEEENPKFGERIRKLGPAYYRDVVFSRSGRYLAASYRIFGSPFFKNFSNSMLKISALLFNSCCKLITFKSIILHQYQTF